MTVTALFFAHYQDAVGAREQRVPLPDGATVETLAADLARRFPALPPLLTHGRVAVNAEFADGSTPLAEGDEVAWMPPMSGGAGDR